MLPRFIAEDRAYKFCSLSRGADDGGFTSRADILRGDFPDVIFWVLFVFLFHFSFLLISGSILKNIEPD
jgi:hypothetical protein